MFPLLTQNSLSRKRPFVGYRGWCCVFIILRCQDRHRHWTGLQFRSLRTSPRFHLVINHSISHNYPQYEFIMYGSGRLQRILPLISYYFQLNLICLNSRIDVFLMVESGSCRWVSRQRACVSSRVKDRVLSGLGTLILTSVWRVVVTTIAPSFCWQSSTSMKGHNWNTNFLNHLGSMKGLMLYLVSLHSRFIVK